MGKNQIKVSQAEIRKLVREAIQDKLNGVFSTDDPKAADAVRNDFWPHELYYGEDEGSRISKESLANLIDRRANGEDAELDLRNQYSKRPFNLESDFEDAKKESELYDKPFGDLDDAENQWKDEPGYEEDDDDEDIAGINEGKVTLTEEGLRDFVSYSVARLLKEAYRPIYRNLGNGDYDYDGDEYVGGPNSHGNTEIEFSNGAVLYALEEVAGVELNDQYKQEFLSKYGKEPSEDDFINDMAKRIGFGLAVDVYIDFDVTEDPGDYWTPGYTYVGINSWEIDNKSPEYAQASDMGKKIMNKAAEYEIEGNADELYDRLNEEVNKGALTHFDGKSPYEPENPYKDMSWDEYCEAKRMEREKDQMKSKKPKEENPNHGTAIHFSGKKREMTPDDIEGYKHAFDNQYWVNKMNLSKDELTEMIGDCVKKLTEEMGLGNGEEEAAVERFPKKAGVSFTEKYGRMDVKCKALVSISDAEVVIDLLQYGPEGWEPEMEWMFSAEEYTDGAWLPYWETLTGDAPMKVLARFWPKIMKALIKIGYLADEDDEIPFRFAGDIKVGNKRF